MDFAFVSAFQHVSASPIRALLKAAQAPGMISFAGGVPAREAIDLIGLRAATAQVQDRSFAQALQYGETQGDPALQDALLRLSQRRGLTVRTEELLITSGAQQALDLLLRATLNVGDVVLVACASYPGALQAFRLAGAVVITVQTDAEGMLPDALAAALAQWRNKVKLVYMIATFDNPTGHTWSRARRIAIAQCAAQHGVLLVEDDAYGLLRFRGTTVEPVRALAGLTRDNVVYISTLSKVLAPGLRVGWLVGHPAIVQRCIMAKQVSDMCTSALSQAIAANYLQGDGLERNVADMVQLYRTRCDIMVSSLHEHFGDALTFHVPDGGLFLWLRLPPGIDAGVVFHAAAHAGVLFVPGEAFGGSALRNYLRLSFSCTAPDDIPIGVRRLKHALRAS